MGTQMLHTGKIPVPRILCVAIVCTMAVSGVLVHGGCGYDPSQSAGSSPTPVPGDDDTPIRGSPTPCADEDGDGICRADDCNDRDPTVYPGAAEVCDLKDNDCDGVRDIDADGDGYVSAAACPAGDDCDDSDPDVHPGAAEVCNYADDDCNGVVDDGVEPQTYYRDSDGDGYGAGGLPKESCVQPPNYSPYGNDCNDTDADIYPGADEVCNGIDDDCDGVNDNGVKLISYPDEDGDGFGDGGQPPLSSCTLSAGYVLDDADCDDSDPAVNPDAEEVCNNRDDDCNGEPDDGLATSTYYLDADADGHGVSSSTVVYCALPEGYAPVADDCDDTDALVYPGAEERCNGADDDCDLIIPGNELEDGDGDGSPVCADCDDTDPLVAPTASESCNGIDDDCDGLVDEDFPEGAKDTDGDGVQDCLDDCPRWVDAAASPGGNGTWVEPYTGIQEAIDTFATDASCAVVRVWPGEYAETIDFKGYPLLVEAATVPARVDIDAYLAGNAQEPESAAVIDGQGGGPVVTISQDGGQEVALIGFVIRNGSASGCGGAIRVTGGSPRIAYNRIEYATAESGAGVCVLGSGEAQLLENDFIGNAAATTGGGLHVAPGAAPEVSGNQFLGNTATDGGGVFLDAGDSDVSTFRLDDNAFYLNLAERNGGAIAIEGRALGSIAGNAIAFNQADYGGGLLVNAPPDLLVSVTGGYIEDNTASTAGGGVMATGTGGLVLESMVVARCASPSGGGVFVDAHAGLLLNEVTLDGNGSLLGVQGGGVHVSPLAKATINSSIIQFNVVSGDGGGIFAGEQASLTIEGSYVGDNGAQRGGGIFAQGLSLLDVASGESRDTEIAYNATSSNGGGIYLADFDPDVTNGLVSATRIHDNQAANGAGMVIDNSSFVMTGNQIRNNTAVVGQGGGVLCQGEVSMKIPVSNLVMGNEPAETEGCD